MRLNIIVLFLFLRISGYAQPEIILYNEAINIPDNKLKISKLDEAIKLNPKFWNAYQARGSAHFNLKNWEQAASDFQNSISYMPSEDVKLKEGMYYNAAVAYANNKNWIEAGKNIQEAYKLNPIDYNILSSTAWIMEGLKDSVRAITFYTKAATNCRDNVQKGQALSRAGRLSLGLNNKDEALRLFNAAVEADFINFEARYYRASIQFEKKEFEFARQDYSILEPQTQEPGLKTTIIYNRALCLWELKNEDDAIKDFSKVIDIDPKYTKAYINRANLYNHRRLFNEGEKDLETALSIEPTDDIVRLNWIQAMTQNGKHKKALEELTNFSKKAPNNAKVWYYIGVNRLNLNREEKTKSDFEKAVKLDPLYAEAWHQLALTVSREDSFNLAEKYIQKALSIKKDYWDAMGSLGEIKARNGKMMEGLKYCNEALKNEQSSSNYISLCEVQNQIGDYYTHFQDSALTVPSYKDSVALSRNYYLQALSAAEQAIAKDKFAGGAYFVRANCKIRLLDNKAIPTEEVFNDIKKAEELMPSNASVRLVHAMYLVLLGKTEDLLEAEKQMNDALDKKPNIQNGYNFIIKIYDALIAKGYDRKEQKAKIESLQGKKL